jgi:membrane protease YdiL (CAAX protease family)
MRPVPRRFRLWKSAKKFARQCLPADLTQLLFLGGLVSLTVAVHQRWLPSKSVLPPQTLRAWSALAVAPRFTVMVASFAGYWLVFRPGLRPLRRVFWWVLVPVLAALLVICGLWRFTNSGPAVSVLDRSGGWKPSITVMITELWALRPGIHYLLLGLVLVTIFAVLVWRKTSSLPLQLMDRTVNIAEEEEWAQTEILICAMLGAQAVAVSAISGAFSLASLRLSATGLLPWIPRIAELGVLIGICELTVGRKRMNRIWKSLLVIKPNYLLIGVLFPSLIALAFLLMTYIPERIEWATGSFEKLAPPEFFASEIRFESWWLALIPAAFAEEFVFRGILQKTFIDRYGLMRGLVLVNVLWGAFHFPSDGYWSYSSPEIPAALALRVVGCVAIGFALSWVTLRAGTILPATLAHALSNMLLFAGFFYRFGSVFDHLLRIGGWTALAYVLFRYWRPRLADETAPSAKEIAAWPAGGDAV